MFCWILYDKQTTYYLEDGQKLTPEIMYNTYPQSKFEDVVLLVSGITVKEFKTLDLALSEYNIVKRQTIEEDLELLNFTYSTKQTESTPIERIASSLEYISVLLSKISGGK